MPKRGGRRHVISLYGLEEKICGYLKATNDWALKNSVLDVMSHIDSRLTTKSRVLVNMFNANQYKILNTCAMFLSPFVTKSVKKVTWVNYKPHTHDTETVSKFKNNLTPLFTSFVIWEYLIDRPYQTTTASITQLHELFPQWSVDEWTQVIEKLNSFFKQINNAPSIRAEIKRMESASSSSSHYPWWKYEPTLQPIHESIREKLDPLMNHTHKPDSVPMVSKPNPHPRQIRSYVNSNLNYTLTNELIDLSALFYDYFRHQLSMSEIQHKILECRFDRDETKRRLESSLKNNTSVDETFPEHLEQLQQHFKHRFSSQQLFQLWKQSHGNWNILKLI